MTYELFKEVVAEKILGYMSPELQNSKVDIHSVDKVNQKLDGLNIVPNCHIVNFKTSLLFIAG